MSCIFNIFKSKKKTPERRLSFVVKMSDPIPKKHEELVEYEAFLRMHLNRMKRRYDMVNRNLLHYRSKNEMSGILLCMKERQEIEMNFEKVKARLTEVLKKRSEFEGPAPPRTPTLMLEVVKNPLVTK
jgi:hypothetical protein